MKIDKRAHIAGLFVVVLATVFALSWWWEHGLERIASEALGLHYEAEFEAEERGRFIATSMSFAALATIAPFILLTQMFGRLQTSLKEASLARDAAQASDRAKSAFLANMSHELRTPLNGVLGIASVLAAAPLRPEEKELVKIIEQSADNLNTLLNDIVDLSRIEAGKLDVVEKPVQIEDVVTTVTTLFAAQARAKGLTLSNEFLGDGASRCCTDPTRLQQVLTNIVSNAVRFTAEGGVRVVTRLEPVGERIALTVDVVDTGIGFDPAQTERLFGRFEQADGSNTREFGGAGLGLAISRGLAEALGGTLTAVSQPGAGSTFTLKLVLHPAGMEPVAVPSISTAPPQRLGRASADKGAGLTPAYA